MWQFASMLQFTDTPFSADPAVRGIVLLVYSLTSVLISYGRASNSPWIEFLPAPSPSSYDGLISASEEEEALVAAAASKDNTLLIALSKFKEAARNKARPPAPRSSCIRCPSQIYVLTLSTMQARVEKLKAAQLARKASAGAASLCGGSSDAAATLVGECVGVVEEISADAGCTPSSPATLNQLGTSSFIHSGIPENYARDGAEVHVDFTTFCGSEMPNTNSCSTQSVDSSS
jgi:hypothetical protein